MLKIPVARTFKEGIISHRNCFQYFLFFSFFCKGEGPEDLMEFATA